MSYTKGPWELSDGSVWAKSPFNARVRIADIRTHAPMNGIDSEANAHLIAVAPEMLEALEALVIRVGELDRDAMAACVLQLDNALKAIKKARCEK